MRASVRAGFASAVLPLALAACSLFFDGEGLSDAPDGPAGGEAGALDAAGDAPFPATDAAGANGGSACDAGFCDDFDQGELGARWTRAEVDNGALAFETALFLSAPRSLAAKVNASNAAAFLVEDVTPGSSVRCSFSVRVRSGLTGSQRFDIFYLHVTGEGNDASLRVRMGASQMGLREDVRYPDGGCGCPRTEKDFPVPALDAWHAVVLETDFTEASLAVDGQLVVQAPFIGFAPATTSIRLGISLTNVAAEALYDDLACDVRP